MIDNKLSTYSETFSFTESETLRGIREATETELNYADMISGKSVVGLLRILIQLGGYKNILEIGMFTGYATLGMAEILPEDGRIITFEMNERYASIARRFIELSEAKNKIEIRFGNAREQIHEIDDAVDLIFLDADKQYYPEYYMALKPKLRKGGLFVVDNVFWDGGVLELKDRKSLAIHKLSTKIKEDPDMQQVMLTIRDGILIALKL